MYIKMQYNTKYAFGVKLSTLIIIIKLVTGRTIVYTLSVLPDHAAPSHAQVPSSPAHPGGTPESHSPSTKAECGQAADVTEAILRQRNL